MRFRGKLGVYRDYSDFPLMAAATQLEVALQEASAGGSRFHTLLLRCSFQL